MKDCTTEEFWQQMRRPGFVRLSLRIGQCGADKFYCETPPELIPGFMRERMREVLEWTGATPQELECFDKGLPLPQRKSPWQRIKEMFK